MIEKLQFMTLMFLSGARAKRDERGATATEYSLLVAFIALGIILGVTAFGDALDKWFSDLGASVGKWTTG